MGKNVEIKARLADPARSHETARRLSGGPGERISQEDTFFAASRARLKLRVLGDGRGELISYERADEAGPKESAYSICRTDDPRALGAVLAEALGTVGTVRKTRTLYLVGRTRIHIDEVEGLGDFLELEVVLSDGEGVDSGRAEAERMMQALGIAPGDLVDRAYVDMPPRCGRNA